MALWSVQRIGMLDMEPREEPPIYIAISSSDSCKAKLQLTYYLQHTVQFQYKAAAGHLSLLKMTHWNVSAVMWIGRVSQIILPEILSLGQNVCTCILLQHSGIDRTLHYCWGPVSSFKECLWLAIWDISSLYGRLTPKWNNRSEWDLVDSLHFLLSQFSLVSFILDISRHSCLLMSLEGIKFLTQQSVAYYRDANARR